MNGIFKGRRKNKRILERMGIKKYIKQKFKNVEYV